MRIDINKEYFVTINTHDYILNKKKVVEGKKIVSFVGYYNTWKGLYKGMLEHKIHSLDDIKQVFDYLKGLVISDETDKIMNTLTNELHGMEQTMKEIQKKIK